MPDERTPAPLPDRSAPRPPPRTGMCGFAPASLVFAFLLPPLGLVLGVLARVKIARSGGLRGGTVLANLGIVLGGLFSIAIGLALPGLYRNWVWGQMPPGPLATLKLISISEEQFKNAVMVDQDVNGIGEYGFLSELGMKAPCRGTQGPPRGTPFVPPSLGEVNEMGVACKSGWCFKLYLPGESGSALEEPTGVSLGRAPGSATLQERVFVVYAWPWKTGRTGTRLWVIDTMGRPFAVPCPPEFSGPWKPPPWDYAFQDSDGDGKKTWNDMIGGPRWQEQG